MKQAEDTKTVDMFDNTTTPTTLPTMTTRPNPKTFTFHIRTRSADGKVYTTAWHGLTRTKARNMYAYTQNHQPSNVVGYGWAETNCYEGPYEQGDEV